MGRRKTEAEKSAHIKKTPIFRCRFCLRIFGGLGSKRAHEFEAHGHRVSIKHLVLGITNEHAR